MQPYRFIMTAVVCLTACTAMRVPIANAHDYKAGSLVIEQPWTRATPGGAKVAAGYMTITNKGTAADRLIGGAFPRATRVEIHEMKMEGHMMRMRPLAHGLEIKPGQTVKLAPGGYHVMFIGLKQPLTQGEHIKGQLTFQKAGTVDVEFVVESIGAKSSGGH
jgi:periplasmic copper chaperone A